MLQTQTHLGIRGLKQTSANFSYQKSLHIGQSVQLGQQFVLVPRANLKEVYLTDNDRKFELIISATFCGQCF